MLTMAKAQFVGSYKHHRWTELAHSGPHGDSRNGMALESRPGCGLPLELIQPELSWMELTRIVHQCIPTVRHNGGSVP